MAPLILRLIRCYQRRPLKFFGLAISLQHWDLILLSCGWIDPFVDFKLSWKRSGVSSDFATLEFHEGDGLDDAEEFKKCGKDCCGEDSGLQLISMADAQKG